MKSGLVADLSQGRLLPKEFRQTRMDSSLASHKPLQAELKKLAVTRTEPDNGSNVLDLTQDVEHPTQLGCKHFHIIRDCVLVVLHPVCERVEMKGISRNGTQHVVSALQA
jgi:hypothetical protein